jgi:hypothetical protein
LHPLRLQDAPGAALDRRVRATDRLTRQAATHKRRIKDLVGQLLPASPLTVQLGKADLAVLERYGTPQTLAAGPIRLARLIQGTSRGQQGAARAAQWLAAAQAALALYGGPPGGRRRRPGRRGPNRGAAAPPTPPAGRLPRRRRRFEHQWCPWQHSNLQPATGSGRHA